MSVASELNRYKKVNNGVFRWSYNNEYIKMRGIKVKINKLPSWGRLDTVLFNMAYRVNKLYRVKIEINGAIFKIIGSPNSDKWWALNKSADKVYKFYNYTHIELLKALARASAY